MNYAAIKPYDIANGPGVRVSLFVSGCTHHCPGCFNPETWDFDYGEKYNGRESLFHILDLLKPDYINGLTILGGEPLEPQNMVEVFILIDMVRRVFSGKKDDLALYRLDFRRAPTANWKRWSWHSSNT